MAYSDETVAHPSAIKRFSHSRRFQKVFSLMALPPGGRMLDYGSGDGYFPAMVSARLPEAEIVCFEPTANVFEELLDNIRGNESIKAARSVGEIGEGGFHVVTCLEVFEHLDGRLQRDALDNMSGFLADNGSIILSVPMETGLSSLLKNLFRLMKGEPHGGLTPGNIIRSLFSMKVDRKPGDSGYIATHVGFNYREMEALLGRTGLLVVQKAYSPLPLTGPLINSQVIYVLKKKA